MRPCVTWIVPAVGLGVAAFGAVFVLIGSSSARASRAFERVAVRTPGEVLEIRYESAGAGTGRHHAIPVVRFELPDGRTVETEARMGASPGFKSRGEVTVLYDPEDPRRARVDSFGAGASAVVGGCMASLGATLVLIGLAVAIGYVYFSR
jgi:hypothetical protein